jgi:hypothetical protein
MTEEPRRGRPPMSKSQETADYDPVSQNYERPRETVKVEHLPDPPGTEVLRQSKALSINLEEQIVNVLKEEMDELSTRLERFGIRFDSRMQQEMVDIGLTLLSGFATSGGAISSR